MAFPVRDWLREFSLLTGLPPKTTDHFAIALREANLFPSPGRGGGAWNTRLQVRDAANFLLAVGGQTFADIADTVGRLRSMRFAGAPGEEPYFPECADFGDFLDSWIEALALGEASADDPTAGKPTRYTPSLITISAQPDTAELIWLGRNGAVDRRNAYGQRLDGTAMVRRVALSQSVIELAAYACAPDTESTTKTGRPQGSKDRVPRNAPAALMTARGRGAA